ncbi:MAG: CxxxxCH/CxxCH domain-containing protein [Deltaproteobacteria bacterium]|nr:CxxxxCH/CxxCH domain-containing protein [Deltaproteobacteria bacterium]
MTDRAPLPCYPPSRWLVRLLGLLACSLAVGCLTTRNETAPTPEKNCAGTCHGSADSPAPPKDTKGSSLTSSPGVGAHANHLTASATHTALACETCHVVPKAVGDPGHVDNTPPTKLNFTGIAAASGRQPYYDDKTHTCVDTYCHSGPTGQGWPSTAVWNAPRASDQACGTSCHSLPPGGSHPTVDRCELCHGKTAGPNHTIKDATLHINGKIDVSSGDCSSCHGSSKNPAPPTDLAGNTDTKNVGVGAHQSHLAGSTYLPAVTCETCHKVPAAVDSPGHIDTPGPAELTFTAMASAQGASPVWNHDTATCSGVYCHGATLTGGSNTTPKWTVVDGSQAACGTCHGLPPSAPHPKAEPGQCIWCHKDAFDPATKMPKLDTHINAKLEIYNGSDCTACHGSTTNPAPPQSLSGATDPTDTSVGAHQVHLNGGTFSRKVLCEECHVVPTSLMSAGHIDDGWPATLTWSGVSVAGGSTPAWDHATVTCNGTWCHGAPTWGGANSSPVWNKPGTAFCGTCHALPPGGNHPAIGATPCSGCHALTVSGMQIVDRERHINGQVDFNQ